LQRIGFGELTSLYIFFVCRHTFPEHAIPVPPASGLCCPQPFHCPVR